MVEVKTASSALLSLVLAGGVLVGCGNGDEDASGTTVDVATVSWQSVVDFNEALVNGDLAAAADLAAAGSSAAQYVQFREDVAAAEQGAGLADGQGGTVQADEDASTVTITIGSGADEDSYAWSGFATDAEGRVTDWSTEQGPISDALWSEESTAMGAGAEVALSSAFVGSDGDLFVVIDVSAGDEHLTPDPEVGYLTSDDRLVPSRALVGAEGIEAAASEKLLYVVPGVGLGGEVVYEVQADADAPFAVELGVA